MKLRDQKIKEGCKRGPIGPRQNLRIIKKHQNTAFGKRQNDKARHHHGLPVVVSTDVVVGRTAMLFRHMAMRPLFAPVSFVPFRFPTQFFGFCPLKDNVSGHFGKNFHPIPFTILHLFQSSFREKEGEVKTARNSFRVCDRGIQARFLAELSFPSLLFFEFQIHVCNLLYSCCFESWNYVECFVI